MGSEVHQLSVGLSVYTVLSRVCSSWVCAPSVVLSSSSTLVRRTSTEVHRVDGRVSERLALPRAEGDLPPFRSVSFPSSPKRSFHDSHPASSRISPTLSPTPKRPLHALQLSLGLKLPPREDVRREGPGLLSDPPSGPGRYAENYWDILTDSAVRTLTGPSRLS